MKLKIWLGMQFGKLVLWGIQWGIGWVETQTPEHAQQARLASKQRILAAKAKALETSPDTIAGAADDILPQAGYVYMGFATMQKAQYRLAAAMNHLDAMPCRIAEAHDALLAAIRILDEQPAKED